MIMWLQDISFAWWCYSHLLLISLHTTISTSPARILPAPYGVHLSRTASINYPHSPALRIEWQPLHLASVAGYRLYWTSSIKKKINRWHFKVVLGAMTSSLTVEVHPRVGSYYVRIMAFTKSGQFGSLSDVYGAESYRNCHETEKQCPEDYCVYRHLKCPSDPCDVDEIICENGACVSDGSRCPEDPCPAYLHRCDAGNYCFSEAERCDYKAVCKDNTDEVGCTVFDRPHGKFLYIVIPAAIVIAVALGFKYRVNKRTNSQNESREQINMGAVQHPLIAQDTQAMASSSRPHPSNMAITRVTVQLEAGVDPNTSPSVFTYVTQNDMSVRERLSGQESELPPSYDVVMDTCHYHPSHPLQFHHTHTSLDQDPPPPSYDSYMGKTLPNL